MAERAAVPRHDELVEERLITWYFLAALAGGYGPAWLAHFFVEKTRPATFTYPLWSLVSVFRMVWCWISGKLARELEKAGVVASGR